MRGWKVWVEPSGDGRWRCRWRGKYGTGQQTFLYKADADDTAEKRTRAWQRVDAGLPPLPPEAPRKLPISIIRDKRIAWEKTRHAEQTVKLTERAFALWMQFAGEDLPVTPREQRLTGGKTVSDFCDWLLTRDLGKKMPGVRVNGAIFILANFKASMKWAHRQELIDTDPFLNFEFPAKVKVGRYLAPAELLQILRAMPELERRAVYFNLHCGLRSGELDRSRWEGIFQKDGRVFLTVIKSKTRKRDGEATKTICLHPNAVRILGTPQKSGQLFPLKKYAVSRAISTAAKKIGLGRVRWHDLRHTWATNFLQEHKDPKATMLAGGWTTLEVAMGYQHETEQRTALAVGHEIPPEAIFSPD